MEIFHRKNKRYNVKFLPSKVHKTVLLLLTLIPTIIFLSILFTLTLVGENKSGNPVSASAGQDTASLNLSIDKNISEIGNPVHVISSYTTIPCSEKIVFNANASGIEQTVNFYNPSENECFFAISIICENEVIYHSGLIPPGNKIDKIEIDKSLPVGSYAASIVYDCYSLNEMQPLNGATQAITLEVIQ